MKQNFPAGRHLITQPLKVTDLIIESGAVLEAPEGKFLTLMVNGVGRAVVPGTYHGDVELALADLKIQATYPSVRRRTPIPLKAAVTVDHGTVDVRVPGIIRGGSITDSSAKNFYFATSDPDYAALVIDGDGDYTVENARIILDGEGNNDFVGMGAGVAAIGNTNVTINNSEISLTSVTRCAVHVGGTGTVTVNNSKLTNLSPQVEMGAWSWGIAIRGTNRLCQLADDGTVFYNNCQMRSNGWGILSVDGSNYAHMHIKDCDMELEGAYAHGYGVFCIGPTDIHLDHTRLNVNGFPVLLRGMERKGIMDIVNGTEITGRRFGLHSQGDTGSIVTIRDSSIKTDKATFLIKGSTGTRYDIENTILEPGDGNILQLIDSDDPGLSGTFVDVSMYNQPDTYIPGRNLTEADPDNDITMNITSCTLKGNFLNSTSDLVNKASKKPPKELVLRNVVAPGELGNEGKISGGPPPAGIPGDPGGPGGMPGGPGGMPGGPGGMPGGPGGMPDGPGGMPEGMPPFMMGETPHNLVLNFKHTTVEGTLSSATQKYRDGLTFLEETIREELSHVYQTPAPTVNNGVLVSLDENSCWKVTGTSYLTRLELASGAQLKGSNGNLTMTVDGIETPIEPGTYTGKIVLSLS